MVSLKDRLFYAELSLQEKLLKQMVSLKDRLFYAELSLQEKLLKTNGLLEKTNSLQYIFIVFERFVFYPFRVDMDLSYSKKIGLQLKKITEEFTEKRTHCHFMTFDSSGPTWEKRVEIRNLLVKDLEFFLKRFPKIIKKGF